MLFNTLLVIKPDDCEDCGGDMHRRKVQDFRSFKNFGSLTKKNIRRWLKTRRRRRL